MIHYVLFVKMRLIAHWLKKKYHWRNRIPTEEEKERAADLHGVCACHQLPPWKCNGDVYVIPLVIIWSAILIIIYFGVSTQIDSKLQAGLLTVMIAFVWEYLTTPKSAFRSSYE